MSRAATLTRRWVIPALLIAAALYVFMQVDIRWKGDPPPLGSALAANAAANPLLGNEELPDAGTFEHIAETDTLILSFDGMSGHFLVTDKRNGAVWHSYPNPEQWEQETIAGVWKHHLRSPIMIQTLDFSTFGARPQITNWISANGAIEDYTPIAGGVRLTYAFPGLGVSIPMEIRIEDDYVEMNIRDGGIREANHGLLWVRPFPFFGAERTDGGGGYFLIPDGSGAIVSFKGAGSPNTTKIYKESIYGQDLAYLDNASSRNRITMPVYGMNLGERGFLAVVENGEEYADVIASPAGVYSSYNWIGNEMRYRSPFRQVINRNKGTSFTTYDKEQRFGADRTVRYYLLTGEQSTYAGMASRYRRYLMEEHGYERISATSSIPLHLSLVGGDKERGLIGDRYVAMTTSSQAMEIVQTLYGMGIEYMNVNLLGWQKGGFTSFGSLLPIEARLGGDEGVRSFIDYVHSLESTVMYGANYVVNNTGAHGFSSRYSAMRDMSGTILNYTDWYVNQLAFVSHRFLERYFDNDMRRISELQFDGIAFGQGYLYGGGLGQYLISDYNSSHGSSRSEAKRLQAEFVRRASETFSSVGASASSMYVNQSVGHIYGMADDYSYDLFSDRSVPFLQIALHGLTTYSSAYINEREAYRDQLLRDLEYGALPSFIFTYEPTHRLNDSYGLRLYSSQYKEWVDRAVQQYQIYSEALQEVQDRFIVDHRSLAPGVFLTSYENGVQIVVNYNDSSYDAGGRLVEGKGYAVLKEEHS